MGLYLLFFTLLVICISYLLVETEVIERGRHWIPTPKADRTIQEREKLVVFDRLKALTGSLKR